MSEDFLQLLSIYGQYMHLKLFVDSEDQELRNKYVNAAYEHNSKLASNPHEINAGFDLYAPCDSENLKKIDHLVICSAQMVKHDGVSYNTGYYLYPRSSISKTPMRLANSVGIIDTGYRGHLIAMFDVLPDPKFQNSGIQKFDRYVQLCAPSLLPIVVEIVDSINDLGRPTQRGAGGFGSTGIN